MNLDRSPAADDLGELVDLDRHPLAADDYRASCRAALHADGAVVLRGFLRPEVVERLVDDHDRDVGRAFFADSTHNVELTDPIASLGPDHPRNRQVVSSKGLIADDQLAAGSNLRRLYGDPTLRSFIAEVVGVDELHPYADPMSSINVHLAPTGRELGWHFDNSSFAVTLLLRAADDGGVFEYVTGLRGPGADGPLTVDCDRLARVLDGDEAPGVLSFAPGDLVLFRGRHALHRVTPTIGETTRMLVVFAYNDEPGVALSASAMTTFYGRTA